MDPGLKLHKNMPAGSVEESDYVHRFNYPSATGELLYLAIATRPDIARTVSFLCRFNANPGPAHCKAVQHLWRYLKGTMDLRLTYAPSGSSSPGHFVTYSDADHGGCFDSGQSTTGFVVKMGSGAVSWSSKLQGIVALSTTEAEYVAACAAGQEIVWLRHLLGEIGYPIEGPSQLYVDNQSALAVAKNPEHHGRMKHLDLRFYWLRHAVAEKTIEIAYLPTRLMPADILTKSLPGPVIADCREKLGVV
jgi:hypothetical protein